MHANVKVICAVLFVICEFLAAIGVPSSRVNLIALGLFFFGVSLLV
jgi:hypothetical protein